MTATGPGGPVNVVFSNVGADLTANAAAGTVTANDGNVQATDPDGSVLVEIAGPLTNLTINFSGSDNNNSPNVSDIYFDVGGGIAGDDSITAGAGDDIVHGSDGNDTILGESGLDTIEGGLGNDRLFGGTENDQIFGGGGTDSIEGGADDDTLFGGTQNDTIFGGAGSDVIDGGDNDDSIDGGDNDDIIEGGGQQDTITGGEGADLIFGDVDNSGGVDASPLGLSIANLIPGSETASAANSAVVGDSATYQDIATVDGTGESVYARIVLVDVSDPDLQVDLASGAGFEILLNSEGAVRDDATATVRMEFFIPDAPGSLTGTPIKLNAVATFNDIDQANGTESVTLNVSQYTAFGVDANTALTIDTTDTTVTANGGADESPADQEAWFSAVFEGRDFIEFTLGSRNTAAGFTFEGEALDDPILVALPGAADNVSGGEGNDTILGQVGNGSLTGDAGQDQLDGGVGDDTVDGGVESDLILGSAGSDSTIGGDGDDTLSWRNEDGATSITDEIVTVTVDDQGDGSASKTGGQTDSIETVENFVADEDQNGNTATVDTITLSTLVTDRSTIQNIDRNAAVGTFTTAKNGVIPFGGVNQPTLAAILAATNQGTISITSGDESGSIGNIGCSNFETINFSVICFARGVRLDTPQGPCAVEALSLGDVVNTLDHGLRPVRWIGSRRLSAAALAANPHLRPITIKAGVLGNARDLSVSPQHRMLVSGPRVEMLFGEPEVLVAAKDLVDGDGIYVDPAAEVEYFHIFFDEHEIVFAEGAPSESLHPGAQALSTIDEAGRAEILELFPELEDAPRPLARSSLKRREALALIA